MAPNRPSWGAWNTSKQARIRTVHIVAVVGARPQFIKAAVVLEALRAAPDVRTTLIHTGQHYDANLSDIFFEELQLPRPDYHLGVGSAPHGKQTARMLEGVEDVLLELKPDWALVFGDTNSTLAGALAAVKLHVPVAHVEAGLRSFNRLMPEEINRVLVDHASELLFAPTENAVQNLRREGIAEGRIHWVGDVMYDVALRFGRLAEATSRIVQSLGLAEKQYVLATVHRAENTDNPSRLAAILAGLATISREIPVVFPVHPRTQVAITRERLSDRLPGTMRLIAPVGYLDMLQLEKHARLIATDSGGVQKEAFFYGVPCVTLRSETEWMELVEAGWNHLVRPESPEAVVEAIRRAMDTQGKTIAPYGHGDAARQIATILRASGKPAALPFRLEEQLRREPSHGLLPPSRAA